MFLSTTNENWQCLVQDERTRLTLWL